MDTPVKRYEWYIGDFSLRLTSENYSLLSPLFVVGDRFSTFFLKLNYDGRKNEISIHLNRSDNDENFMPIETRYFIYVEIFEINNWQKYEKRKLHSFIDSFTFLRGSIRGFIYELDENDLLERLRKGKDVLVITLESVGLEPSFTYFRENVQVLSDKLIELRYASSNFNATLISRNGYHFPVHKEILSARSSVFSSMFSEGSSEIKVKFPQNVVDAMLDFLYSGDVRKIGLRQFYHRQLFSFAKQYKISDLKKYLAARITYFTNIIGCKTEHHILQFTRFTELCNSLSILKHQTISMRFDPRIEMKVKMVFEPSNKLILKVSLQNLHDVKGVRIKLFHLDNFYSKFLVEDKIFSPEEVELCHEFDLAKLFSEVHKILPKDIFTLQFELKFRFSKDFTITDTDTENYENRLDENEFSDSLLRLFRLNIPYL